MADLDQEMIVFGTLILSAVPDSQGKPLPPPAAGTLAKRVYDSVDARRKQNPSLATGLDTTLMEAAGIVADLFNGGQPDYDPPQDCGREVGEELVIEGSVALNTRVELGGMFAKSRHPLERHRR
jgi:hypothetical protein